MPVKQMMKMSGFIPRRRLRGLTPETATRPTVTAIISA